MNLLSIFIYQGFKLQKLGKKQYWTLNFDDFTVIRPQMRQEVTRSQI